MSPDLLISVIDNVIQKVQRYHVLIKAYAMKKATFIMSTCNDTLTSEVTDTVHSEIFTRVVFSRNFAYAKFRKNKILAKWRHQSAFY